LKYSLFLYKYRFFFLYIVFGTISLFIELVIYSFLDHKINNLIISSTIAVIFGIMIAFWLNIRYNFKISKSKRNKALKYFVLISSCSYILQISIINSMQIFNSYELSRIIISGTSFWIGYLFHKKYSFKDYKKVGVAIYANGVDDIDSIYRKVLKYPDFIHVDIIDKTIKKDAEDVLSYKTEVIKGFWNNKFIEAHIMSKAPKKWILNIVKYVNRIYIHTDLNEEIIDLLNLIKANNCEAGIVVQDKSQLEIFEKNHLLIDSILVLAINKPGFSGQIFEMKSLELISLINNHKYRDKISLNIDGGVNANNISLLKSENVVSGSFVLNSNNPIKNIMILQTSSQYESI
jgi:ribulose-phosphate 3-epimerase